MTQEIERKFLVVGDGWQDEAVRCERLIDGLLATSKGRKVRVRLYEARATLTVKTQKNGRTRLEFEYEIPRTDAQYLLEAECGRSVIAKTRHSIPYAGFTWVVDVYEAPMEGVVLAEVEMTSADQDPLRPAWIGREVTDDPAFRKRRLFADRVIRKFAHASQNAPGPSKVKSAKATATPKKNARL